jgi:hypothetical protein
MDGVRMLWPQKVPAAWIASGVLLLVVAGSCGGDHHDAVTAAVTVGSHRPSPVDKAMYLAINVGASQQAVLAQLGAPNEWTAMTVGTHPAEECWSYLALTTTYIFCFENGALASKSDVPTVADAP